MSSQFTEHRHFLKIEPLVTAGDFVYLDPPYHPTDELSFTKYTKENFTESDQVRLRDFVVRLHKRGAFIMLSNSNTKFIRDLYGAKHFHQFVVMVPRTVNCKPLQRNHVEVLLTPLLMEFPRDEQSNNDSRPVAKPSHGQRANQLHGQLA